MVYAGGMSREASFEVTSSQASSEALGIRVPAQGLRVGNEGSRASWQGLGAISSSIGRVKPSGSSNASELDISCLVDNTPFRINEVGFQKQKTLLSAAVISAWHA